MKPLKDFIKVRIGNEASFSVPENSMFDHFFIEFGLNGDFEFIVERYGKYDGQIELVSGLAEEISKDIFTKSPLEFSLSKEDLEGWDSVFYDKLTVIYDPDRIKTGYVSQENFDKETQKFKEVLIYLSASTNSTKDRIRKSLMHELTHAWHDYCSFIGKGTSLSSLAKETKYYHKIRKSMPIESGKRLCKSILYLTSSIEKGSYLSEIYSELSKFTYKLTTWEQAKELFHKSSTYKQILRLYDTLSDIDSYPESFKNDFANFWNEMNETNLTLNKIAKRLLDKLEKLFDKIESNCAKIYFEWSQKQEIEEDIENSMFSYYDLI